MATARSGTDTYGREVAVGARLGDILLSLRDNGFRSPLTVMAAVTVLLLGVLGLPGLSRAARRVIGMSLFWLGVFCLLYLSQWVFYGSSWPTATAARYSFPGLLFLPASVVLYYWGVERLPPRDEARSIVVPALRLSLAIGIMLVIVYHGGFVPVARALDGHVAASREFTDSIERMSGILRGHPRVPLVVESGDDVWADYERVYSYPRFFRAYQVTNPLFLRTSENIEVASLSGIHAQLASGLDKTSLEGDEFYSPLLEWEDTSGPCFSLFLSADRATSCTPLR